MLALKFLLMVFGLGLFGVAAILVAYDVYMATRLRSLLQRNRHPPPKSQEIGEATRAASYDHRPKPLRVVRIASLEGGMTMSKKPSTAALDTFRLSPFPTRRRASRHPAGETTRSIAPTVPRQSAMNCHPKNSSPSRELFVIPSEARDLLFAPVSSTPSENNTEFTKTQTAVA